MAYIAIENIGDYKKGQEVPEEQAKIWMSMYLTSPVKLVESQLSSQPLPVESKQPEKKSKFSVEDVNKDGKVDVDDVISVTKKALGFKSKKK